jgi:hypothetical protein
MHHAVRPRRVLSFAAAGLLFLVGFLACGPAARAQGGGDAWRLGVRVSSFDMTQSPDSYDAVYGSSMTLVGVAVEWHPRPRWFLALSADTGDIGGEQVVFLPAPTPSGVATTLKLTPVHISFGRHFRAGEAWSFLLGVGPSQVSWEESSEFGRRSGNDTGLHLRSAVRRAFGPWELDLELLYSTIPDAFADGGAAAILGEGDIGGLALSLGFGYRL